MKAKRAPEKIYACFGVFGLIQATEIRVTSKDVEYTRTDAFIEKALKYIRNVADGLDRDDDVEAFISGFRKYMKGE